MIRKLALFMVYGSILALSLARPLYAQTAPPSDPLLSLKRMSIAAGVDREVLLDPVDEAEKWLGVLGLAYNVLSPPAGPRVSLIARWSQPFNLDARPSGVIGLRVTLFDGSR